MNKILILLLFFFLFPSRSTGLFGRSQTQKRKNYFCQKRRFGRFFFVEVKPFAKNFKKKYTDEAFVYEFKTPEKNAWDRFKEWLANVFKNIFEFTDGKSATNFVDILLKVIAISIVVFVIYLIAKAIMNKEGQWIFGQNSDRKIINYDEIEKNLHLVDFEKLIQKSLESGEID